MWDIPESRMELMSLALAGGFLTTEPPEKPYVQFFAELAILFNVAIAFGVAIL